MKQKIKRLMARMGVEGIMKTATLRQSGITFLGTAINGLLGAGFYILLARALGPADYGLFAVAVAVLTLIADVSDLGTDTGLVRFVSRYIDEQRRKALRFLKASLEVKLVVWVVVLILGWGLVPYLAGEIFGKPELTLPLRLALVGVGGAQLFSFVTHFLQAGQRFWTWSLLQMVTNAGRLVLVAVLFFGGRLMLIEGMWSYIVFPFLGFVVGSLLLPMGEIVRVKGEKRVWGELFTYNKWVAAFTLLAALSARLDTFISARLLPVAQVGIYAAAGQLVVIVPQIVAALGTVVAPKFGRFGDDRAAWEYLKKVQYLVLGVSGLGLLAVPVVVALIPVIYGMAYVASGPLFVVLFAAMLLFLISVPWHMAVFYYFGYPRLFFWISVGHLAIVAGLGWVLIGAWGAMGAAVTVLCGNLFGLVVPAGWVWRKFQGALNDR